MLTFLEFLNENNIARGKHQKKPIKTVCFKVDADFIKKIEQSKNKNSAFSSATGYSGDLNQDIKISTTKDGKKIFMIQSPWDKDSYMEAVEGDALVLGDGEVYRVGQDEFQKSYTDDQSGNNPLPNEGMKKGTNTYVKYGFTDAIYVDENTPLESIKKELKLSDDDVRISLSPDKKNINILTVDSAKPISYPIHGKDGTEHGIVLVKGPNNDLFTNTFKKFKSLYKEEPLLAGAKVVVRDGKRVTTDEVDNYDIEYYIVHKDNSLEPIGRNAEGAKKAKELRKKNFSLRLTTKKLYKGSNREVED